MAKRHRFKVVEHFNGYAIFDTKTNKEAWLGDGVDTIFTLRGKSIKCGTEYFRRKWESILNASESEVEEAYNFN